MSRDEPAVYVPSDVPNVYQSTGLANAGWYEEGQHGGAFSALVVGHVETMPTLTPMQISRLTVEMFRVIPLVELRIEATVVREGKRIQTIRADVFDPEDSLLSTAMVQRLRVADVPLPEDALPPPLDLTAPGRLRDREGEFWGVGAEGKVVFHRDAMDVREIHGGFEEKGPAAAWLRPRIPIIAGRETTPAQRVVAAADFSNGLSRSLDYQEWVFMNPDLTVHISRYPEGEWIALDARSAYGAGGRGLATASLWDEFGFIGRSTQTLYLDRSR